MNQSGAATQICSHRFDRRFFNFPPDVQRRIQTGIDELGRNLRAFSHYKMQGVDAFRLRVGDYRVVYEFDLHKNELHLVAVGHRRDVYRPSFN
jgi:mRNA interferase RelE/StbE